MGIRCTSNKDMQGEQGLGSVPGGRHCLSGRGRHAIPGGPTWVWMALKWVKRYMLW